MDIAPSTYALAFALTALAGLSTGIGGFISVIRRREPSDGFLAAALGLSAGVMIYVSLMELMPNSVLELSSVRAQRPANWIAVTAFFAGVALIAVIDRLVPEQINPHEPDLSEEERHALEASAAKRGSGMMRTGVFVAGAIAVHNFPEGFATFISGLEDLSVALPVAAAIAIHNIPEGIAVAVPLRQATGNRRKAFWWALVSGLAEPLGALVGFAIFMPWLGPLTLGILLAAVAGVMVYISIDELLPAAIATGKHHAAIYGLIAGMAVMAFSLLFFL